MLPRAPSTALARPRLDDRLSSDAACVVLCGPTGSGRTTALAAWAAGRDDVVWCDGGEAPDLPDVTDGVLVVDDADGLDGAAWDELARRLRRHHGLKLRLSVHTVDVLPAGWDFDLVTDLSFTPDETAEHLTASGSVADPRLVCLLTAGLPAAVRAVVRFDAVSEEQVLGAMARDQGMRLPDDLAPLAVPAHLTDAVVADLGGPADFLERAARAGWGTWSADPAEHVFTLTAPRRLSTLRQLSFDAAQERDIRSRAARLLLDQGFSHAALVEAAAAGDVDLADAALKQGGMPLVVRHGYELNRRLAALPLRQVYRYPVLALARALVLNARRATRMRAVEMFGVAVAGARSHPRHSSDRALMRVVESVGSRLVGLGDGGLRAARRASEMMADIDAEDRERLARLEPDLHVHTAVSLYYGGDHALAATEFEKALVEAARPGVRMQALGGLALIESQRGDMPAARYWVDLALEGSWTDEVRDGYAGSMLRLAEAHLAIEELDFDAARDRLEPVWQMVDTIEHWPLLVVTRALVDVCSDRAEEGLELLRRVRRHRAARRGASARVQRRLDIAESQLMCAAGDMAGARRLSVQRDDPASTHLAVARIALLDGRDDRALDLLRRVDPGTPLERFGHATMQAVLLARLGRDEEARGCVEEARTLHRTYGLRSSLLFVPAAERDIFADLMDGVPRILGPVIAVPRLTPRERVVLDELVLTENVAESAARLQVSVNTVKSQRRSLYRKLGATSRDEALALALAHGLLD